MFRKDPFLALYFSLSSLMIFQLLCLVSSAALFTLTIWPFPSPPRSLLRWRPHKELCFDWSADQSIGVSLLIRENDRLLFSPWISTKITSFYSRLRFNPTPTFLGVIFDLTLSFSKHVFLLKAKFFPRLKALVCISASSWGPSKESVSLLYKAFLRPLITYSLPGWFPFKALPILTNWNASAERLVAPTPAASRPPLSHFFTSPYESP